VPDTHGFGILTFVPQKGQEFNEYEPEKYGCIFVPDDDLYALSGKLAELPTFYHNTARPEHDLAYYGITLIPPESLELFQRIPEAEHSPVYDRLIEKIRQARRESHFMIHFGI